jgi:hypothetical protein
VREKNLDRKEIELHRETKIQKVRKRGETEREKDTMEETAVKEEVEEE